MKVRSLLLLLVILFSFCVLPVTSKAQLTEPFSQSTDPFGNPITNAPPPIPPDPIDTPFDGGISILIGAGIIYGIKKARGGKKDQNQQNL